MKPKSVKTKDKIVETRSQAKSEPPKPAEITDTRSRSKAKAINNYNPPGEDTYENLGGSVLLRDPISPLPEAPNTALNSVSDSSQQKGKHDIITKKKYICSLCSLTTIFDGNT